MNWIDIVIIIAVVATALIGWRMGLIRSALMVVGIIVAVELAAQISEPLAAKLNETVKSDSIATVVAYLIVGAIAFLATQVAASFANKLLATLKLGWVNTVGGAAMGAMSGLIMGAALVAVLARLAFLVPESFVENLAPVDVRSGIKGSLLDSALANAYVDVYDVLPGSALGLIPGDFKIAIEELDRADGNG